MDNSETLRQLIDAAIALHLEGDLQGALACYSEALDIEPDNTLVLYNVGCLFEEAGALADAADMFAIAAMVTPFKDPDIVRALKDYGKKGIN